MSRFYISTPIYYVNDRPHIGHVYTTLIADVIARYHRLKGDDTFLLTGTDEHSNKVIEKANENGMSAEAWSKQNADAFKSCFQSLGLAFDDFIRTSEQRHKDEVRLRVSQLLESGDVYLGEYEGWYDEGQEEYVTQTAAEESNFLSPINKRPLVRRREQNYFFRLSAYADALIELIESDAMRVQPPGRKQEMLARIRDGLNDVPVSRISDESWGIQVPGQERHVIYVWIDALLNYLSAVDTDGRRHYWPADVHLVGKDILWFHAVIWPALLLALRKRPGNEWIAPPTRVHAHGFWIREGEKMSKSMGNFVDLEEIDGYVAKYGLDAMRLFLVVAGPLGAADADFARERIHETYNTNLVNTVGNSVSRTTTMLDKYFEGVVQAPLEHVASPKQAVLDLVQQARRAADDLAVDRMTQAAVAIVREVDLFIQTAQPFKMTAPEQRDALGGVLYTCIESLRLASLFLWPVMPEKMGEVWTRIGCAHYLAPTAEQNLDAWCAWGGIAPGTKIEKGEGLFPRLPAEIA
ncbi:MAG: methionine--tRNA ligase [Xanthomonadaceae bacterium]|nr:methionine--tRNA ligase [Xanthomonadaceae bacterium]